MPEAKIPTMLSRNFSLHEAEKSTTAIRLGIDNSVPKGAFNNVKRVAEHILQRCRDRFGYPITPSSWYRCGELNAVIGGAKTSQHMRGEAVDFEIPQVDNLELFEWMIGGGVPVFDQVILEHYVPGDPNSGWIHASIVEGVENNRMQVLETDGKGGYKPYGEAGAEPEPQAKATKRKRGEKK
ncbi:MAG: D-Ala-D-Ala carboxypeptidase family metallohydrolase [Rhodospirillaceae bacterium]|nr:D-Ala-D-Ala carboxypeptidase family metallohydrolase [Rhodospirillaceae bacterium]